MAGHSFGLACKQSFKKRFKIEKKERQLGAYYPEGAASLLRL